MWHTALLMVLLGAPQGAPQTNSDTTSIQGRWLLVAVDRGGTPTTPDKNVNNVEIVFGAEGNYAVRPRGFDFRGHYRLDPIAGTLDITVRGRTVLARYELEGDQLRICEGVDARPAAMAHAECTRGAIAVYHRRQ